MYPSAVTSGVPLMLGNGQSPSPSNFVHNYLPTAQTTSGGGWVLLLNPSGLAIPGAGLWRIAANIRFQYSGSVSLWVKSALFTSATLGSGQLVDNNGVAQQRQLINQVTAQGMMMNPECKDIHTITSR